MSRSLAVNTEEEDPLALLPFAHVSHRDGVLSFFGQKVFTDLGFDDGRLAFVSTTTLLSVFFSPSGGRAFSAYKRSLEMVVLFEVSGAVTCSLLTCKRGPRVVSTVFIL